MHLTLRQLKVLSALAEHGSITAAAKACHITQPTVSMLLKELAETVGMPLYEQIGKRLYLTTAGELAVDSARRIGEELENLAQGVAALQGHTRGRLRVAVVSTAKYFVPRMLGRFCRQYPEIEIAFEVQNRDGIVARLRKNADDLYIMSMPPDDIEVETHGFLDNPLAVLGPPDHPLANGRELQLADLAGEMFVLRERGSGTRMAVDKCFAGHGFAARVRLELGSNEAIKHAVAGGLGLTVLSLHALAQSPQAEGLAVLPVAGFPIHSNWSIVYPKGKRLSPIAAVFFRQLLELGKAGAG